MIQKKYTYLLFSLLLIPGLVLDSFSQAAAHSESPGVRNGHSMVYHQRLKSLFIFGGADEKQVLGETWIWSRAGWKKLASDGPPARTFGTMVYMSKSDEVVLFGGNRILFGGDDKSDVLLNDTWIWRDGKWFQINTTQSPDPRSEAAMVYDAKMDVVILFGGFKFSQDGKSLIRLGDTWKFDGETWSRIEDAGPSPRSGSAMAYDSQSENIILFGGNFARKPEEISNYNGTTWRFNNYHWDSIGTSTPNVYNSAMTYDPKNRRIVRFGGWSGSERLNETWQFKANHWTKLMSGNFPQPRNHAVMVYSEHEEGAMLYGGHDGQAVFGDLWILDETGWRKVFDAQKKPRIENNH